MKDTPFYGKVLADQYEKKPAKEALLIFMNELFGDLQDEISALCQKTDEGYEIRPDSFHNVGKVVHESEQIFIENVRFFPEYKLNTFERLIKQRFPGLYQPLLLARAKEDLSKAGMPFEFNPVEDEED